MVCIHQKKKRMGHSSRKGWFEATIEVLFGAIGVTLLPYLIGSEIANQIFNKDKDTNEEESTPKEPVDYPKLDDEEEVGSDRNEEGNSTDEDQGEASVHLSQSFEESRSIKYYDDAFGKDQALCDHLRNCRTCIERWDETCSWLMEENKKLQELTVQLGERCAGLEQEKVDILTDLHATKATVELYKGSRLPRKLD